MSLNSGNVSRLWKCSIKKVNTIPETILSQRSLQQVQLHVGMGGGGFGGMPSGCQFVATAIPLQTTSNRNYLVLCTRPGYVSPLPPATIHWSGKISPNIFICQQKSTTQAGSTFVFLVVTVSLGSRAPPVLFSGGKSFWGRVNRPFLLISSECVVWHVSTPSLNSHCKQASRHTHTNKKGWWMALSREWVFKVNILK